MDPSATEKQPLLLPQDRRSSSPSPEEEQPTLSTLRANVSSAQREYMRAWSRTTSGRWHRNLMISVTILLTLVMGLSLTTLTFEALTSPTGERIPLEAHIMSKCPDAKDCLHDLILPVMQRVSSKVDFKLSYIGKETTHDNGVSCMHGPAECLGNMLELCAAHLYPSPKIHLGFTMCLTRAYERIPDRELVEDCALEHGIDFERLNSCAVHDDGALAVDMLKTSFNRSAEAGVTKSCTIRLDDEIRCVRDGGEWKECPGGWKVEDLVREIDEMYEGW